MGSPSLKEQAASTTTQFLTDFTYRTQRIESDAIANLRDLGGLPLTDGFVVKRGLLLRGGALNQATPRDLATLQHVYHLSLVVDLRSKGETLRAPDPVLPGVERAWLPAIDPKTEKLATTNLPLQAYADLNHWIVDNAFDPRVQHIARTMYLEIVKNDYSQVQYASFMQMVINAPENHAVYWHCSQGKDRTGLGAAFLLAALGADMATIMQDYAITNEAYAPLLAELQSKVATPEEKMVIQTFIGVNTEAFLEALQWLADKYGSLLDFLHKQLLISDNDIALLRRKYTMHVE